MDIPAFAYFVFLLFLIPSLAISAYALLIYRLISRIESRARYLTTLLVALTLAITITALLETEIVKNMAYATLLGNFFMFALVTIMAAGIATPVFALEGRMSKKQRIFAILSFSIVLTLLFMKGFAEVMGTPTSKMDLFRLIDYRDVLRLGRTAFYFISFLLFYFEMVVLSSAFYVLCYGLVVLFKRCGE